MLAFRGLLVLAVAFNRPASSIPTGGINQNPANFLVSDSGKSEKTFSIFLSY